MILEESYLRMDKLLKDLVILLIGLRLVDFFRVEDIIVIYIEVDQ